MDSKIEAAILKNLQWVRLSAEIRQHFGNEREYNRAVLTLSVQHQLKWDGVGKSAQNDFASLAPLPCLYILVLVKHVQGDREVYYGKVIEYSRDHLMLFPYHLSRHIIREMRVTPFQYYVQMVQVRNFWFHISVRTQYGGICCSAAFAVSKCKCAPPPLFPRWLPLFFPWSVAGRPLKRMCHIFGVVSALYLWQRYKQEGCCSKCSYVCSSTDDSSMWVFKLLRQILTRWLSLSSWCILFGAK